MKINPIKAIVLDLRNRLDFTLRQSIHFRLPGKPQPDSVFDQQTHIGTKPIDYITEGTIQRLTADYHIREGKLKEGTRQWQENLFYLQMLENSLIQSDVNLPDQCLCADIGPSSWFYVSALYSLLKFYRCHYGREVNLDGFEIDPWRIYINLYSRWDHARVYMDGLEGVSYHPHPFRTNPASYDVITLLFPFLFLKDHLEWGLPRSLFNPKGNLDATWSSLKPGGLLIIANQGEEEHQAQLSLLYEMQIPVKASFCQDDLIFHYDIKRYVSTAIRT
jgi:hypothetical protein